MECYSCRGASCERCGGTGRIALDDCPVRLATGDAGIMGVIRAYRWLNAHGILPAGGGLVDQTASFQRAVDIIDDELASIEKSKRGVRDQIGAARSAVRGRRGPCRA